MKKSKHYQDDWSNDGKHRNETGERRLEDEPRDRIRNILGKEEEDLKKSQPNMWGMWWEERSWVVWR